MNKVSAIWNLFRKGQQVANPEAWKDAQNFSFLIGGFLLALVNAAAMFGWESPVELDASTANAIGLGIASAIAFVVNNISSKKAGILPALEPTVSKPAEPDSEEAPVQRVSKAIAEHHADVAVAVATHAASRAAIDDDTRERAIKWAAEQKNQYGGG